MKRWATIAFVSAYVVVLAGSIVRMSGAGMGCPDWPRCFGLTIPPTSEDQIRWQHSTVYGQDRMLIESDTLWVAQRSHTSGTTFTADRISGLWAPNPTHNYAKFNVTHTWTEFINRLSGAWAGIPATVLFIWSISRAIRGRGDRRWQIAAWSTLAWVLLLVVAWLGKLVVEGHLIPSSITIHMLGALGILIALLFARQDISMSLSGRTPQTNFPRQVSLWLGLSTLLALSQLVMGTQVREGVDLLVQAGVARTDWLVELPSWWKLHRSFSWLLLATNLAWIWPVWRFKPSGSFWHRGANAMSILLCAQIITGLLFTWFAFPAWSQPVHLVLAMGLVLLGLSLWRSGYLAR
jgi:cytochrome c oxidase assembly protein subunit 15